MPLDRTVTNVLITECVATVSVSATPDGPAPTAVSYATAREAVAMGSFAPVTENVLDASASAIPDGPVRTALCQIALPTAAGTEPVLRVSVSVTLDGRVLIVLETPTPMRALSIASVANALERGSAAPVSANASSVGRVLHANNSSVPDTLTNVLDKEVA